MSDRLKVRLVAAGTSTFLSVLIVAALLLGLGVLSGRLVAPTLPGGSQTTIALPALTDTTAPPATGPGAIPPGVTNPRGNGNGGGNPGPGPTPNPGPGQQDEAPAVGAQVHSGDVGGLGLIEADLPPIRLGSSSGESTTTSVDVLGVQVDLETSDNLLQDVICVLICR